jgi:hypothetical protein
VERKSRYGARFRVRALAIFNNAVQAGLEQEEHRWIAESPTTTLGVRKVAEMMGMIAHTAQHSARGRPLPITPGRTNRAEEAVSGEAAVFPLCKLGAAERAGPTGQ